MRNEISQSFVYKELKKNKPSKATGMDNITPRFLKDSASVIAPLIIKIANLSIGRETVPDDLKCVKVTHLYKKNRIEIQ